MPEMQPFNLMQDQRNLAKELQSPWKDGTIVARKNHSQVIANGGYRMIDCLFDLTHEYRDAWLVDFLLQTSQSVMPALLTLAQNHIIFWIANCVG